MVNNIIELGYIVIAEYTPEDNLYPNWMTKFPKDNAETINLDPNAVIIDEDFHYILNISYPLTNAYTKQLDKKKYTRRELVNEIVDSYKEIYASEENPGNIPGMANRNKSEGKYGIWGHHLDDLILISATLNNHNKTITLSVDS